MSVLHSQFALSGRADLVDDAHVLERGRCVDAAVTEHALRGARADALGQQAHAASAGKQAEQDFRKAKFAVFFGDDEVGGQRGLESASEGASLNECEIVVACVPSDARPIEQHVGAGQRISVQGIAVAAPDAVMEMGEVATEAEIVRDAPTS